MLALVPRYPRSASYHASAGAVNGRRQTIFENLYAPAGSDGGLWRGAMAGDAIPVRRARFSLTRASGAIGLDAPTPTKGEAGMAEWTAGSRKGIAEDIAKLEAALKRLRAMHAELAEMDKQGISSSALARTDARPTSLSRAVQLALRKGASPVAEVIVWVQRHYDDKAKPHSIRSTLAHLKKKGVVDRGGKNWYLLEKDRQ